MSRALRFTPLALLLLLLAGLVWRLSTPADTNVRSRLEGKPVPSFQLPPALAGKPGLSTRDLATGKPRLVNIFASWCVPCITEVRVLKQLRARGVEIDGIAIRDRPADVAAFLAANGDPYGRIGADAQSEVQIALGSSGVPESFVVDGRGIIRYQHIGAVQTSDVRVLLARLAEAQ